jgi:uncharacterized protein (TIGR02453 family)
MSRRLDDEGANVQFTGFGPGTTAFLEDLVAHQDRAWFADNRARYDAELLEKQRAFVDAIGAAFAKVDPRVQAVPAVDRSIFRIFRDVRFSRDKSPYKTYSDVFFWVGEDRKSAPGYFMRIAPGEVWAGCGAHSLKPEQLARLRAGIIAPASGERFASILSDLEASGFEIGERTLARVPAGFPADSPRADLLRLTVVHAIRKVSPPPPEFASAAFVDWSMANFLRTKPLVDWLAETI